MAGGPPAAAGSTGNTGAATAAATAEAVPGLATARGLAEGLAAAQQAQTGPGGVAGGVGVTGRVRLQLADDEAEGARLAAQAAAKAQAAVASTLGAAAAFDVEYSKGVAAATGDGATTPATTTAATAAAGGGGVGPDLTAPSTMPVASVVAQPSGFRGKLKGYQLKGVQWLVNLYDQVGRGGWRGGGGGRRGGRSQTGFTEVCRLFCCSLYMSDYGGGDGWGRGREGSGKKGWGVEGAESGNEGGGGRQKQGSRGC